MCDDWTTRPRPCIAFLCYIAATSWEKGMVREGIVLDISGSRYRASVGQNRGKKQGNKSRMYKIV